MDQDPLEALLVDASTIDRARMARVLRDILGIDAESGRVLLRSGFHRLSARYKVLAYLLGRKAAVLLDRTEDEPVAPKDIFRDTGIPSGTIYPELRELRQADLVSQTPSSEYYVASHQVSQALDKLEK